MEMMGRIIPIKAPVLRPLLDEGLSSLSRDAVRLGLSAVLLRWMPIQKGLKLASKILAVAQL